MPARTRTRYGRSPWIEEFPKSRRPAYPLFKGELTVPVVIIGGGLTGCATAFGLAAAGIRAVLVEAERIGHRGTGHSAGLMSGDPAPAYRAFEQVHGRRKARAVFDLTRQSVRELAAAVKRLGIRVRVDVHDALHVARWREQEKSLRREADARATAGLDAPWLKPSALAREAGLEGAGAFRRRECGHTDPYRLAVGFAVAAAARKAELFERSPVRRLRVRKHDVEVVLPGGTIHADTVIVCTGEPTDLHRSLARHFKREERYAVLTEPLPAAMRRVIGKRAAALIDQESPAHHVWWTADHRVMVAGGDQARTPEKGRDKVWVQRTGQLMYELLRMYPVISGLLPAYGWDVPLARSADGMIVAGPHRNFPRQLFAWGGAHDPAHALLASRILVRHVRGEADKVDRLFSFTRG